MSITTYRARLARKQADRAIKVYQKELQRQNLSERQRNEVKSKITELKRAANATRKRTKSGRIIKSRTDEKIENATLALKELASRVEHTRIMQRGSTERRNRVAQSELFKALSGDASSIYSQREAKTFMHVTMEAWQRVPAGGDRIRAIMDYYQKTDLREFMQEVLDVRQNLAKPPVNPAKDMTEEQRGFYDAEPDVESELPSTEPYSVITQMRDLLRKMHLTRDETMQEG